jgi:hypothetical protein
MYAQLPPEDEGPDGFMFDPRDDAAFNHFLLDSQGRPVGAPAPVGGKPMANGVPAVAVV